MEVASKRTIKSGSEFDRLFPVAHGGTKVIQRAADLSHTMNLINHVVDTTLPDTIKIAKHLKGATLRQTAENIWWFVHDYIRYEKDAPGIEQIRRPARTWADRKGDCDCYSVFISSILRNLNISHTLRITKYGTNPSFSHIYPIIPIPGGGHITLDVVAEDFDFEVPYASKIDNAMQLHYLNGPDFTGHAEGDDVEPTAMVVTRNGELTVDAADLMDADDDLGFLKKITSKIGKGKVADAVRLAAQGKIGQAVKTGVQAAAHHTKATIHAINRVNPGTAILRGGFILSLKLNVFNVAGRLRYAYLTLSEANALGLSVTVLNKYKGILRNVSGMFHRMGGKPENMRKAMLEGKGNRKNPIHPGQGSGNIISSFVRGPSDDPIPRHPATPSYGRGGLKSAVPTSRRDRKFLMPISGLRQQPSLRELIGDEIYFSEFPHGMDGLGELGEPATAAALAAAAAMMATIAGLLKSAGDMKHQAERITGKPILTENLTPPSPLPLPHGLPETTEPTGTGTGDPLQEFIDMGPGLLPDPEMVPVPADETVEVDPAAIAAAQDAHTTALANGASEAEARAAAQVAFVEATPDADKKAPSAAVEWFKDNWVWAVPAGVAGAALLTWGGIALGNYVKNKKAENASAEKTTPTKRAPANALSGPAKSKTAKRKPAARDPFSGLVGSPLKTPAKKPARKTTSRSASKPPSSRARKTGNRAGIFDGLSGSPLRKPTSKRAPKTRTTGKAKTRKSAATRLSFL